ncbi:DUF1249 domain-containing protein [methane-oxidizing endosymbiont of Gigantopelta aegis]|uniref:DUF1249 domain-containing protein n=1 Tax=methane-oxidizing endosymbiont of Gigantopelta aegis TaxID=2794938 RepID=UPI0018DB1117|nr:DUF1249 domain-containing protein [methane-oxidizing endosymbiont of Gigantopelta aegis]
MGHVQPINTSWCLEKLCESNYQKLLRLIPELKQIKTEAVGLCKNKPAIHLEMLEQSRYTVTIKLSHRFGDELETFMMPEVVIRIYFDAQLAEVLSDHARHPVSYVYKSATESVAIMHYKWRLNYFLDKWLTHCLKDHYHFSSQTQDLAPA